MDLYKESRLGWRFLWVVQGIAITALCAGSPFASAATLVLKPHFGYVVRSGGSGDGGTGQGQSQQDSDQGSTDVTLFTQDTGGGGGGEQPVPVPEPGTLALVFAGLTGLLLTRLRRRSTCWDADSDSASPDRAS